MSNTAPFVVSVIAGSSFISGGTKREYKTKVVWTNNAPNDHVHALTAHDSRALKKIYGYDPLDSESVAGGTNGHDGEENIYPADRYLINMPIDESSGGAETIGQNSDTWALRASSYSDQDFIQSDDTSGGCNSNASGGNDDEFSLESLGEALSSSSQTAREKEARRMFQARFAPTKKLSFSREITVIKDIWVLEEDNLMILKRKIQLATGIPTYRQHLWYEVDGATVTSQTSSAFSPCYTIRRESDRIETNIWNIRNVKSMVHGMPVDSDMYAQRTSLSVRNNEFSTTLEMIFSGLGSCGNDSRVRWYVVDVNDFISDREQLSTTIRNDIHMRELIYFGFILQYWPGIPSSVFQTFVSNEPLLHDEYPEFALSDSLLMRQYGTETSIIAANPQPKVKDIPMNIYLSASDIGIVNEYYSYGVAVDVRMLFDSFLLNAETPYMIARFALGGRTHTLVKSYASGRGPSKRRVPPVDTVCIFLILQSAEALLYVHSSGIYHTEILWREDLRIDIDSAKIETVANTNKLISRINSLGETVVTRPLVSMTEHNINVLNTNIVLSIGRRLTPIQFEGLKENAGLFKRAGMLNITSSEANTFMFHFYKGMHVYDDARFEIISNSRNGYEYTTNIIVQQRHDGIYGRQKLTTITARSTDIYIHATGIKFSEYAAFIKFILILIEMPIVNRGATQKTVITPGIKAVSQLKELDPVLYDLKKIYGNKTMYSQICQKPNQPIIVNKPGPKSVKFWNFTRKEPAYYECPSAKFSTLYFKTGVHPAGFCIPCCKKITVVPGSKHEKIFATCMQDHSYDAKSKNATPRSGYIISYTPEIAPGRIAYLPEANLDQLFYQQFSTVGHSVDSECIPDLGYYVFGIEQSVGNARYVGTVSSLAHALGLPVAKFISETAAKILSKSDIWPLLLGGKISANFKDEKQFIGAVENLFGSANKSSVETFNDFTVQQWNDVFLDIARFYWDINAITFVDSGDGNILIKVPRGIKRAEELISSQHKHMFLISAPLTGARLPGQMMEITNIVYNPIYQIDTHMFKKTSKIATTLFSSGDKILSVIGKMLTSLIAGSTTAATSATVDLDEIISFLDSGGAYKLKSILINRNNLCYGVIISHESINIYFPIMISLHDHLNVIRDDREFMRKDYNIPWSEMEKLLAALNSWTVKAAAVDSTSDIKETRVIKPETWILLGDLAIGFHDAAGRYNYYMSPIPFEDARKIAAVPGIRLKYDPTEINALINTRASPAIDPDLGQHLYKHHGYQLFVLEFVSSLDQKRNSGVRAAIAKVITRDIKTPSIMFSNLNIALTDWPRDYERILAIFGAFTKVRECRLDEYSRLLTKVAGTQFSSGTLNEIIEQSRFEFDDIIMTEMFEMPAGDVLSRLTKTILPGIIEIGDPLVPVFPGGLRTCGASSAEQPGYCRGKKLIVSSRDYPIWSKQLALDIKNPLKQCKLVALMTHRASNEFSFTSHPGETIYISIG